MWQTIWEAVKDTLIALPFLLISYILIELLEHKTGFTRDRKGLQGKLAPLIGSATGIIPQCGFSVMAAKLYDRGLIRTGTLLAVFLATSDEALIILISSISSASAIMPLIAIKLVVAAGVGYLVNFLLSYEKISDASEEIYAYSCGREHEGKSEFTVYFVSPLLHALKIALYLLAVNLVFGFIIAEVGEDKLASAMIGGAYFQPLITAAIGLIPNCASSTVITAAYVNGGILFGSMVSGLCANAGVGLMVLFRNVKKIKRNVLIVLTLYLISAAAGLVTNCVMVLCNLI